VADPIFLDFDRIEEIHQASLEAYGGSQGIRDKGLIESALGSAMNTFHYANGDFSDIAATYAFHLAQAQAFIDGNKRTGIGAALLFLRANGIRKVPSDLELYDAMIAIAERRMDKPGLADLFRRAAVSLS
jgi:death-on-curing protein